MPASCLPVPQPDIDNLLDSPGELKTSEAA